MLHLSDLHFVRRDRAKARFLAALPPADVTVVTGDFLAEPEAVETAVEAVRPTRGRLASWFVLGSNDYFVPEAARTTSRTSAAAGATGAPPAGGRRDLIAPARARTAGST